MPDRDDRTATIDAFHEAVNMTAAKVEAWLHTEESKAVGQKEGGEGESTCLLYTSPSPRDS